MHPLAVALSLCILAALGSQLKKKRRLPYPPGPPADPIIGHIRHMPTENTEEVFSEWAKIYGDVIHLRLPGRSMVLLGSVDVAADILDKRSTNYSSRPYFPVFELLGWARFLLMLPYGKHFQKHRKIFQEKFSKKAVAEYEPTQIRAARQLVNQLLSQPGKHEIVTFRYSVFILSEIIFGREVTSDDDMMYRLARANSDIPDKIGPPGGTLIDILPILRYFPSWFPGTHYANVARQMSHVSDDLIELPLQYIQKVMAQGESPACFIVKQLENYDPEGADAKVALEDIKSTCGAAFGAGTDTTWASLLVFILAMILHPEHQQMAQEEIETIVGTDRLPTLADRDNLPLVDGILQECSRWHPVFPLGVPHLSMEDDVYNGMLIPKGSFVFSNIRAMSLDSRVYSNPRDFNPTRYLPSPRGNGEPPFPSAFGFGRRICPGRYLADASFWVAIATMLATLRFEPFKDENGVLEMPRVEFTTGFTSHPKPFRCRISPRSGKAKALVEQPVAEL